MPITCYPGHGTICCYPDGHTEPIIALEQVRDFYASNLCLSVMLEGLDSSLFPDSLDLGMYFNNVSTELEFAGLYAEKHPWANTNRFTRFD